MLLAATIGAMITVLTLKNVTMRVDSLLLGLVDGVFSWDSVDCGGSCDDGYHGDIAAGIDNSGGNYNGATSAVLHHHCYRHLYH